MNREGVQKGSWEGSSGANTQTNAIFDSCISAWDVCDGELLVMVALFRDRVGMRDKKLLTGRNNAAEASLCLSPHRPHLSEGGDDPRNGLPI